MTRPQGVENPRTENEYGEEFNIICTTHLFRETFQQSRTRQDVQMKIKTRQDMIRENERKVTIKTEPKFVFCVQTQEIVESMIHFSNTHI